ARGAAARADEPGPRLHGHDQLRAVSAAQDPVRLGEDGPPGSVSAAGVVDPARGLLRARGIVLETPRNAVPAAEAILRIEAGPSGFRRARLRGLHAKRRREIGRAHV